MSKSILIAAGIIGVIVLGAAFFYLLPKKIDKNVPYYFFAIHNEPHNNLENPKSVIAANYSRLQKMVHKADEYNIKLTLMFTAQWADYIVENNKVEEVRAWAKNGHEIAAHHHSEYHPNWDGYSNMSHDEVKQYREGKGLAGLGMGNHLGAMNDFIKSLQRLSPEIKSGCLNDESDKSLMMVDEIIYDTCSGFANSGVVGSRADDVLADKGINQFISTGTVNGKQRKWLGHHMITVPELETWAEQAFKTLDASTVYGVVIHSTEREEELFYKYLEMLHQADPDGSNSRTVTAVIEEKLLPEKEIASDVLLKKYPRSVRLNAKCGDQICDELEKKNPMLCPRDCQGQKRDER